MTDQEILEKYKENIENGVNKICLEDHIEDDHLREAVLRAYQKGFLKGFKKGREEEKRKMVKIMISKEMSLELIQKVTRLDMKTIQEIAREGK